MDQNEVRLKAADTRRRQAQLQLLNKLDEMKNTPGHLTSYFYFTNSVNEITGGHQLVTSFPLYIECTLVLGNRNDCPSNLLLVVIQLLAVKT